MFVVVVISVCISNMQFFHKISVEIIRCFYSSEESKLTYVFKSSFR